MSSNALFSNNGNRNVSKNLVEFKAGKMTMKGKMVYPDNRKGQLYVYQSDDSLMHFCWKDRSTGIVEDDLIIFPEDCEFKHVTQCKTGRVYLLKFKSSSRKFFFWLQDSKTDKDEEYCRKINEVLNNPPIPGSQRSSGANAEGDLQNLLNNMSQQQLMQLFGGVGQIGGLGSLLGTMNRPFSSGSRISTTSSITPVTTAKSTTSSTPNSTASTTTTTTTSIGSEIPKPTGSDKSSSAKSAECTTSIVSDNRIRLSDLQSFLSGIPKPSHIESEVQRGVASELSSAIPAAISTCESLEDLISTYLPAGDSLSTTLSSPQFSQALSLFWSALQSGQAAPVVQQFGLGSEAVNAATTGNIHAFVNALETEALNKSPASDAEAVDNSDMMNTKKSQEESTGKLKSDQPDSKTDTINHKKDNDDDEGMALD
ncbi:proteasomal ubiquitin receptor ADRM1 isoform X1 [Nasonia vitripennis]|uniref:Proteasomal ubiquitin receptor ADRM1 homolog n=1 Tax=Nasonia vitripennis TaxID=7425 RepID=A0A7M7QEB7_NASVI|nr:proteasomal ubiquitin receptor ADRM1 isoform X1 [Nasonia vitripennis]